LERGKDLYSQNCLPCHGPSGMGDGPAALTLNPRPANLQVHVVPGVHSDAQLFEWISNGYPGTAMPAFGERLSDVQRWDLVNYIRTLGKE
jgi:mono/diheme cytochrome c family protein